ncbi:MAG: nucleotidyl transferase AbiEii/AbiGii toxin family protein [Oligoflexia bacterium]|nr:nucleotidyl transferase AbiEii/AbiGii toxin family protein [Oligoflexia bacterium]
MFDYWYLTGFLRNYKGTREKITQLQKEGEIIRVKKGLYVLGEHHIYGGSALRILHRLDRFSEDLDFSLIKKDADFTLSKYKKAVIQELEAFGFEVEFCRQEKEFANTLVHILKVVTAHTPQPSPLNQMLLAKQLSASGRG